MKRVEAAMGHAARPQSVTLLQQQRVALNPRRDKHKKNLGKERLPA
jgi:hypothetical protein